MPIYKYTARDRAGKANNGTLQAIDEGDLRRLLRANELYVVRVKDGGDALTPDGSAKAGLFDPKPSLQDMVIAIRQLGTTVRAGLPIVQALGVVGSQSEKPVLRAAFKDIEAGVSEGQFLSVGMRRYPKLFARVVVCLVEAGEVAGTLDHTLDVAAEQLDREDNMRRRVKSALLYPKLVVMACIGTIAGMLLLVVPTFSKVYGGLHAKLPGPTVLLMSISEATIHFWWAAVLAGGLGTFAFRKYVETPRGRRNVDRLVLKIPVLGTLMRKIAIARFVQTLSGAMRGGVPILVSLAISAGTADNAIIREAIEKAAENVQNGAPIAAELEKSGEFPLLVTRMIHAGETTGNIDAMLDEINRFFERDVEYAVDKLTRMIEPLMTVLVGSIVMLVLLALYMPIFSLGDAFLGKK